jgi:hypothetical protein
MRFDGNAPCPSEQKSGQSRAEVQGIKMVRGKNIVSRERDEADKAEEEQHTRNLERFVVFASEKEAEKQTHVV